VGLLVGLGAAAPAQAAAPDVWAFAAATNPTPAPGEVLNLQSGTFRATCPTRRATIRETATGVYRVTFPCSASTRGIVHVTTVDPFGRRCAPATWAAGNGNEVVTVNCYGQLGLADHATFALLYTTSSGLASGGGAYSYVRANASGALVSTYNSVGATNTVSRQGIGSYQVRLPNRSAEKFSSNLQVTAIDNTHVYRQCKVSGWDSGSGLDLVTVRCYDVNGRTVDSPFVLSAHNHRAVYGAVNPPKFFAYLWSLPGAPSQSSVNSVGGSNGVSGNTVFFSGVGTGATTLQVTGYGSGSAYCQPTQWWQTGSAVIAKDVLCYTAPSRPAAVIPYFVTTASDR
jgi:hypothetical protein